MSNTEPTLHAVVSFSLQGPLEVIEGQRLTAAEQIQEVLQGLGSTVTGIEVRFGDGLAPTLEPPETPEAINLEEILHSRIRPFIDGQEDVKFRSRSHIINYLGQQDVKTILDVLALGSNFFYSERSRDISPERISIIEQALKQAGVAHLWQEAPTHGDLAKFCSSVDTISSRVIGPSGRYLNLTIGDIVRMNGTELQDRIDQAYVLHSAADKPIAKTVLTNARAYRRRFATAKRLAGNDEATS